MIRLLKLNPLLLIKKANPTIIKLPSLTKPTKANNGKATAADKVKIANLTEKNKTLRRQLNESINNNSAISDTVNKLQQRNSIIQQELIDVREQLEDVTQSRDWLSTELNKLNEKLNDEQRNNSSLLAQYNKLSFEYKAGIEKQNTTKKKKNNPAPDQPYKMNPRVEYYLNNYEKHRQDAIDRMRNEELRQQTKEKLGYC
ncbi:hypothetical protein ACJMK2_024051 [Sinanodonta woodiana]|uniref:Uncharacterized protein n=1 Tax=Sinanodonta woodiana TaxID=1069815 RepID=A0ABD3T674_SINWO